MENSRAPQSTTERPDGSAGLETAVAAEIAALAVRQRRAGGLLMRTVNAAGGQIEDALRFLPARARASIEAVMRSALSRAYEAAALTRSGQIAATVGQSDRAHRLAASLSGALGGLGGLPTAMAELPIATTVIFRAVQSVAEEYGEDPASAETRIECLRVFGAGAPGSDDDAVDTAFFGARLSLTGPALHRLIAGIAPKALSVLGPKIAAQAVPVIGAAAGAGVNYAYVDYFVELAHVHFGLRRLARQHGEAEVLEAFHAALAALGSSAIRTAAG